MANWLEMEIFSAFWARLPLMGEAARPVAKPALEAADGEAAAAPEWAARVADQLNASMDKELLLAMYAGAALVVLSLSIPLLLRSVPPNRWYGFRVRRTLADTDTWYAVNAYTARWMIVLALMTLAVSLGLYFIPGISLVGYALGCAGVLTVGLMLTIVKSYRYLRSLPSGQS